MKIGFIGQGYIGKNYANDFEERGYKIVRYALEPAYVSNKAKIKECDMVFIVVPTPTTPLGFDDSIVRKAIKLTAPGATIVIKSTITPGTTKRLAARSSCKIFYAPEFLSEATAAHDASHPFSNIVGMGRNTRAYRTAAARIQKTLPKAPFVLTCSSTEAELIKYAHNGSGYVEVVFFNLMYELARSFGVSWDAIGGAMAADPYIANRYARPVHKTGRGAGGHCFIKDFAALRFLYGKNVKDPSGLAALSSFEKKNIALLKESKKDLDLLRGVYGKDV